MTAYTVLSLIDKILDRILYIVVFCLGYYVRHKTKIERTEKDETEN